MGVTVAGVIAGVEEWYANEYPDDKECYDLWDNAETFLSKPVEVKADVVTVEYIEGESGGENVFGGGEGEIYQVIKVSGPDGEQYFRRDGMYYSYAGEEWNNWREVFLKEKTVTVYE